MKLKTWTAGIAVLALATAPVFAEDSLAQWSYDQMVTPVGCCDDGCDCGDGCGCGSACGGGGLLSSIGPGWAEGFSLGAALGIDALDIGGWTQVGFHGENTLLTPVAGVAPVPATAGSFNNRRGKISLHQQYLYIGKEADGSRGWDIGGRADFMYGIDAQDTQSFGNAGAKFDNGAAFDHGIYGWAIPQLYGEVAINDLSVKIGHFYTLVGYETVTAPDNFFYSHSLTQYNSEPFTHTGVLGTYSGFENMTLYGGWTLGWDTGFDQNLSGNSLLGGFSVGLGDSVTVTYINTYGNFGARDGGQSDSYSHSIVADVQLTDDLNYVVQSDVVGIDFIAATGAAVGNDQVGVNQYLFYQWNDIVTLGSRIEWWKSDGRSFANYTSGANIKLLDNMVLRPEFRTDWSPGTVVAGQSYDETIFGVDAILTY